MMKWFICRSGEDVSGPFSTDEIKTRSSSGEFKSSDLIWGSVQNEWQTINWWLKEAPNLVEQDNPRYDLRQWHYAIGKETYGPVDRKKMVMALGSVEKYGDVMLWTKGMSSWAPLFEFHDVMDELGVNKRRHPRASITGKAVVQVDGQTVIAQLKSISVGGCGLLGVSGLRPGQLISLDIKGDGLNESIRAHAEVRYVAESGYTGLKFRQVSMEAQSAIIAYIKGSTALKAA